MPDIALSSSTPTSLSTKDWQTLLDKIKEGECILCVGPEIYTDKNHKTLEQQFQELLDEWNDPNIKAYPDGLFLFVKPSKRTDLVSELKLFYKKPFPEATAALEKLVQLPFPLILSLVPDQLIADVMEAQGTVPRKAFYWKNKSAEELYPDFAAPSASDSVVYNILGDVGTDESLILSFEDLFSYFESVFKAQSMPEKVKEAIMKAKYFICIGISYDKWYMQLLLSYLNMHKLEIKKLAANQSLDARSQSVYKDRFDFNFPTFDDKPTKISKEGVEITMVPKNIDAFVSALYEQCNTQNLLRTKDSKKGHNIPIHVQIENQLRGDNIEVAIEIMRGWLEKMNNDLSKEWNNTLITFENRLYRDQRRLNTGMGTLEEFNVSRTTLLNNILSLLQEICQILKLGV
jgi:hypothetical protein